MLNVFVLDHPLAKTFLFSLRDKDTSSEIFRAQARRLGLMLALEVTKDIKTRPQKVLTPLEETTEAVLDEKIALCPILRAGLGMVDPFLDFIPEAHIYNLGVFRDEETHKPQSYYNKLMDYKMVDTIYVLDPMLATGGTATMVIDILKKWGAPKIKFVGLVGAPEGIEALQKAHPDVPIFLATKDDKLNENAYIVPGLGDAGDRIFNS
jgi:uracil phosphoribosyltransferase